jgi:hypothetical protein
LIDAATDRHIWARSYDGDSSKVLELQQEIAHAIAAALRSRIAMSQPGQGKRTPGVDPGAYDAYLIGELEAAVRKPERNARFAAYLGYAYAAAGRRDNAVRILEELESLSLRQYVSSFGIAVIHDALGQKERALAALDHAYDDRAVEFAQMAQYPAFKTIASEPRYAAVMRAIGLPR